MARGERHLADGGGDLVERLALLIPGWHTAGMRLGETIPAIPVLDVTASVAFYRERLGFRARHHDGGFAVVTRDAAVLHLWEAGDTSWRQRRSWEHPVSSGAESFIAGTASCRIHVEGVEELYDELRASEVLHPVSKNGLSVTDFGTREFATLDCDGNLLTFYQSADHRTGAVTDGSELAAAFVERLERRDWDGLGELLHPGVVYELPQSRERIRGRDRYIQFNAEYPGDWHIDPRVVLGDDHHGAVLFRWTMDRESSLAIVFFEFDDGRITKVTDFWPEPYEPPPGREHLVERW